MRELSSSRRSSLPSPPSRLSSSYMSATTSFTKQSQSPRKINGGVQRTARSHGKSSPSNQAPYAHSSKSKPKARFRKHDVVFDSMKDNSTRKSLASAEAYALARVQEEFEVLCAARSGMRAEEQHALQRLGDGTMQIQCMKEEVADVRSRLEITDRRIARLRRKMHRKGVDVQENDDWEYSLGVEWKPVYTTPPSAFRSSSSHSSSTTSSGSHRPVIARLEPTAKLDVVLWSSATHPVSDLEIPLSFRANNVPSPALPTRDEVIEVLGETGTRQRGLSKAFMDESVGDE